MRWLEAQSIRLFALLAALPLAIVPASAQPFTHHLAMHLVAESDHPRAGDTVTLALDSRPEAGWHGYWLNPGDAGLPTQLRWTLPKGVTADAPAYPLPTTLLVAGLMNYVFDRPYAPLVVLHIPAGLASGTALPVRVHADYVVCSATVCVPEQADLATDLTIGGGTPDRRAAFDDWRRALPKPLGSSATWQIEHGQARLAIPYPAAAPLAEPYFFPAASGLDYGAPQTVARDGDRVILSVKATANAAQPLDGVLRVGPGQGLAVHAAPGTVAPAHGTGNWAALALEAFAGAVLGGLILNLMPCVFPILSLKALSLIRSGVSERAARSEAVAYAGGVIAVCVALGAVILALRAGGSAVGWAFQLQSPAALLVLMLLSLGIALNLAGLFELPTPAVASHGGTRGAFATGALAAVIATPCTGPFMGAALGTALLLPWAAALAVFAGLGLGLAIPFLAIGFVPALRRRLPRPGAWMETVRRVLSVPMFLTAIALGWVLGRSAGVDGLALALVAGLIAALGLWAAGLRQRRGLSFGWVPLATLGLATISGGALVAQAHSGPAIAAQHSEAFSEARLASLQARHRPVFVYFTADWCLTCKVNERVAIDTAGVQAAFAAHHVAVLAGDWTRGDPVLGRFIEAHNRAGVPLYLFYPPNGGEAQVLPQVLTPGTLEALNA